MKMNIFKPNKKNFYIISILLLTAVMFLLIISKVFAKTQDEIMQKTNKKIDEVANKLLEKIYSLDKDLKEDKQQIIQKISQALDNLESATKTAKDKMEDIENNPRIKEIVEILKDSIKDLPSELINRIKDLISAKLPKFLGGETPKKPNSKDAAGTPNNDNPVSDDNSHSSSNESGSWRSWLGW